MLLLFCNIFVTFVTRPIEMEVLMKQSIIEFIITGVVTICGVKFMGAGENIAWGQRSPEEVMNGWMNSSGHRANILNSSFKKIGVVYYVGANGRTYWTQLFTY